MLQLKYFSILFFLLATPYATRADEAYTTSLIPRSQEECRATNPAMTQWYFSPTTAEPPLDLVLGPVRDQGPIGWCFAHAAADLMSWRYHFVVSAAQMAQFYYGQSFSGSFQRFFGSTEGGLASSVMRAARGKYLCSESDFPTPGQTYATIKDRTCEHPTLRAGNFRVQVETCAGLDNGHKLFPALDRVLAGGGLVVIDYRAQSLIPGMRGSQSGFSNHTSIIVGRQWNPRSQTCDYLVRNSFGKICHAAECKEGYYSMSETIADRSIQRIIYLRP